MTQSVTVLVPNTIEELQGMKVKEMQTLVAILKSEDSDCLPSVTVKSKKADLLPALTEYMGFNESVVEEIETAVQNEIIETVQQPEEMQDVMELGFGDDVPTLETAGKVEEIEPEPMKFEDKVEIILVTDTPPVITGDAEVDSLFAELGLDGLDAINISDEPKAPEAPLGFIEGWGVFGPQEAPVQAEEKPKKAKRVTIPMDAPIPVRNYENLILGIYGNVLEPREEAFPENHKYAGMVYEEVKLERFNPKAHEVFRNTKGNMHLVYTNVGATYLIVMKKPDGTLEPVLEVANKGRGHLRCKQIANRLQVAYNEKADQEVISGELYGQLKDQIELLPINLGAVAEA